MTGFVAKTDFLMFEVDLVSLEWARRTSKKRGWNPQKKTIRASKNIINKRKTASYSEAASNGVTKSRLAGGVYRVSFSSLDARRSGGSDSPLGCHSLPLLLALYPPKKQ